jgi:hypothetical protein
MKKHQVIFERRASSSIELEQIVNLEWTHLSLLNSCVTVNRAVET